MFHSKELEVKISNTKDLAPVARDGPSRFGKAGRIAWAESWRPTSVSLSKNCSLAGPNFTAGIGHSTRLAKPSTLDLSIKGTKVLTRQAWPKLCCRNESVITRTDAFPATAKYFTTAVFDVEACTYLCTCCSASRISSSVNISCHDWTGSHMNDEDRVPGSWTEQDVNYFLFIWCHAPILLSATPGARCLANGPLATRPKPVDRRSWQHRQCYGRVADDSFRVRCAK